jgi:hypothetical protein
MGLPRDHHFIPAFYLRQWCDAEGKLVEYTLPYGRKLVAKPVGPDATGYEFDLYAFPELTPEQSQWLEQRFFDYADRTAADALKLHLSGIKDRWNAELVSAWSRFVIALHLRHPDAMPELRVAAKAIWEGGGAEQQRQYELIRKPGDPRTLDEAAEAIDPLIPARARLRLIAKAFDNELLGQHINGMIWDVIEVSRSPHRFLTSDRPVGLFSIKAPTGIISLPISPITVFVATNTEQVFARLRQRKAREIVQHVNKHLVSRARRFVWGADRSQQSFCRQVYVNEVGAHALLPRAWAITRLASQQCGARRWQRNRIATPPRASFTVIFLREPKCRA